MPKELFVSHRNIIWTCILITVILCLVLYLLLPLEDRTFINTIGIVGLALSILGIAIAYFQILSMKEISKRTQEQVQESIKFNNQLLMVSDLSRKAAMVDEIQNYLRDDKIEMCILRMKDLKVSLNNLKTHPSYNSLVSKKEFGNVFQNFNIDLDNFQAYFLNTRKKIDKASTSKNLELLSTLLLSVELKIKNPIV